MALFLAGHAACAQNLFVGDYNSQSVLEYSGGTQSTFATGLDYPTGLAFDSSGNLFEGDQFSGHIYEWAAGGTTRTAFASGLTQPGVLAFNSAGDLFVNLDGVSVDEFSPAGVIINTLTGFNQAAGLAFDSLGNLYVANYNGGGVTAGFITKITPGGVQSIFASALNHPSGLAFDAAGDLFVTGGSASDPTITEITPGGSQTLFASGLNNPTALAFDAAGNLFVADTGANQRIGDITEFAPNGTKSVFATGIRPTLLAFQGLALPVPEPSAFTLVGLGVIAIVFVSFKRTKTARAGQ
ncbi:MAG TPA: PEP-CTERM sorting domain-containing protein [Verrucomicrobiae bacterium]|nr:PEP-CTERM sorting domain-containing protein [Verrucomicrobiae bacterium]